MKKNKNIQYLLVAMVVAIWGAVAFQFSQFQQDASVSYDQAPQLPFQDLTDSSALETYILQVDYKDPFLGRMNKKPTGQVIKSNTSPKKIKKDNNANTKIKNPTNPIIRYKGYSLNNKQIQRVSLSVNGQIKSYTLGERDGELTLVDMQKDSVVILWGEQKQIIFRK